MSVGTDVSALVRNRPAPPVRIVHLGLGAFSRSHLAWYTHHAEDAADWGIAAYTGRSRALADALSGQDGLYTLIERDADGDRFETIESIVQARPGDDVASLAADLSAPTTVIASLTITESGYRLRADGTPDLSDPDVAHDSELLESAASLGEIGSARPRTPLGRLLLGLEARRRSGAGPIALLSCDNLPDNGGLLRAGALGLAGPELAGWLRENARFVSASVDRITPRVPADQLAALEAAYGAAPVVAEPFRDWVISGEFPSGRPAWETAGARFVEHLEPWEARKLWMLNGAHTLLACLGLLRGRATVAEAIADPVCREAVERLWDEDERNLPPELALGEYRAALIERFANPRIEHHLRQIAADSPTKLALRIMPVAAAELAAGRAASGAAAALAAWIVASERALLPAGAEATSSSTSAALLEVGDRDVTRAFARRVEREAEALRRVPSRD